jgi:hypothetical protein
MWEPLPLIVYGYAIHPLTPFKRETRLSTRNRLSTVTEASDNDTQSIVHKDVVSLEVGDEVYAFEKYTPASKDSTDGPWYRGFVFFPVPCSGHPHFAHPSAMSSAPHGDPQSPGQTLRRRSLSNWKNRSKSLLASSQLPISLFVTSCQMQKDVYPNLLIPSRVVSTSWEHMAMDGKPNLGLPWILRGTEPWKHQKDRA